MHSPVPGFTDHSQNAQCWLKPRLPQPFWLFLKAHSSSYELALAMKFSAVLAVALTLAVASASNLRQPIYGNNADSASANRVNNNAQFATSADATKPGRAPGYRNAWDDCGGVGASATERMRGSPIGAGSARSWISKYAIVFLQNIKKYRIYKIYIIQFVDC